MATITKRSNGLWQSKVRRKGYPSLSKTHQTKAQAEQWARLVESEMDRGVFISRAEAESTTLKEALQRYRKEITPSKKGAKQEINRILAWEKDPLAECYLANIRSFDLAEYRDDRLKQGRSPITVRHEIIIISHLFNIARKEWGMESLANPVQNIRLPKLPKGRDRRLEAGEEELLLENAGHPLKQIIILAIETGMRLGEIFSITWENIDLKQGTIKLVDTKNSESRVVPLSPRAKEVIKKLPRHISGMLFHSLTTPTVSQQFRRLCLNIGIEGLRFHDLRHEATSRLFEKGLDVMEVAAITGHKTLLMLKRYTHLKAENLVEKLK